MSSTVDLSRHPDYTGRVKSDLTHRGPPSARAGRPRNAAATREAVLRSAVETFTRSGYDGAGVREIAEGAGVSAMMVNRCSGSKENLPGSLPHTRDRTR
ncbi:TetR/AcrR family transcriptional regulator [Streptomyces olivaceoviridis]